MKRLVQALAICCIAGLTTVGAVSAATGNSGAAKTCQQGGYLTMQRADGSSFKNAGDCVSYFAQTNRTAACVVTAGTGCLTFDNTVLTDGSGDTLTLNASYTFNSTCNSIASTCAWGYPNAYATGGGTFVITSSTGATLEQGTLTTADTPGSTEGLSETIFSASDWSTPESCSTAVVRAILVNATSSVTYDQAVTVGAIVDSAYPAYNGLSFVSSNGDNFSGPVNGLTFTC